MRLIWIYPNNYFIDRRISMPYIVPNRLAVEKANQSYYKNNDAESQ